jgi:hypothetical protein
MNSLNTNRTAHLLALMKKGDDAFTRTTGTFAGEMKLPDGKVIAPTGKAFDLNFSTTAKWDGDVMVEEFVFWDSALQAQQIGLA